MKDPLIKSNIHLAKQFSHTTRYIDDLLTLNNNRFTKVIPNIYPPELELKRTTESPTMLSYLDILITIEKGKYHTTIFDKRDNFGFNIVNFPHLCSNIPTKPAYGVYISQLIRIGRICDSFKDFTDRHYKLTTRLIQQGFWYTKLCFTFKKFYRIHAPIFSKFNCSVRRHIEEGICLPVDVRLGLTRNVTIRRARQ